MPIGESWRDKASRSAAKELPGLAKKVITLLVELVKGAVGFVGEMIAQVLGKG